ncbi:MAG TPA: hypothetical protein VF723_05365 [Pyrinomonadaceae bacterium]
MLLKRGRETPAIAGRKWLSAPLYAARGGPRRASAGRSRPLRN